MSLQNQPQADENEQAIAPCAVNPIKDQRRKKIATALSLTICLFAASSSAYAGVVRDGEYRGDMRCGPHLTLSNRGPWVQPIKITVTGDSFMWDRSEGNFTETGTTGLVQDRLDFSLQGKSLNDSSQLEGWKTQSSLKLVGDAISGTATILSKDGLRKIRECSVQIEVRLDQPNQRQLQQGKLPGTIEQLARSTLTKVSGVNLPSIPDTAKSIPIPNASSTSGNEAGPLFSRKSQFLEMAQSGQFIGKRLDYGDYLTSFADSVRAVLANDYGIGVFPTDNYARDGVVAKKISGGCKGEFEAVVNELFGATLSAQLSVLGDLSANPQPVPTIPQKVEAAISDLPSKYKSGSWCSKVGPHPYVATLPRLVREWGDSNRRAVEAARVHAREVAESAKAEQLAKEQRVADEKRKAQQQKADAARAKSDAEEREEAARAEYERGAAARNAQKIKAIGLPSNFLSSTLYSNYMGQWSPFMPCAQWIGLLLENKKIASVETNTVKGYPGVSIKRTGQPAVVLVFRMEGKEAFLFATVVDGRFAEIRSPAEHSQMSMLLKVLTREKEMN